MWGAKPDVPVKMKTPKEMLRDALVQHIDEGPHAKSPAELIADLMKRSGGGASIVDCDALATILFDEA